MTRDELEYEISQYLDGTLPALQRNALDERLATDAQARAVLEEYRRLDAILKTSQPAPEIAWDRLAAQIGQAVATEQMPVRQRSILTIGRSGWMAIAASLLFAVSLAVYFVREPAIQPPQHVEIVQVSGPQIHETSVSPVAEISVGPSQTLANSNWRAAEEVVTRPTVVLIDRAYPSGQDSDTY
jgi:anti-sigma factor RsiW